jgi:thiosulfate/3-mercaptopyruvate sulfurtransferase
MTGDELAQLLERGEIALLDVRTRAEYEGEAGYPCDPRQGHISGAVNVELEEVYSAGPDIGGLLEERGVDSGARIVAYCHSGSRSEMAAALLRAAGLDATNYAGSWHEWSRREP